MFRHAAVALLAVPLLAAAAAAQERSIDPTDLVRGWYRVHLGREPNAREIQPHVQAIRKGTDPADVHSTILASDEYYARHENRLVRVLGAYYAELLDRQARPDEIDYWLRRAEEFRGNRTTIAREFVRAVAAHLNQANTAWQPTGPPILLAGNPAEAVPAVWQKYLNRVPDNVRDMVAAVDRGEMTLRQIQGNILASDEYYQLAGGAEDAYVTKLVRDVLGRDPGQEELRYWSGEVRRFREQRGQFVTHFLTGTQRQVAQAVCERLVADERLLLERVRVELGNTARTRQVLLRGNALLECTEKVGATLQTLVTTDQDLGTRLVDTERAFQALTEALSNPPGVAPASEQIAWRISQDLLALRQALSAAPAPEQPAADLGYDRDRALARLEVAARDTQQMVTALRAAAGRDNYYAGLQRDFEALGFRLETMKAAVLRGAGCEEAGKSYHSVVWQMQGIERGLSRPKLTATMEQALYRVQSDVADLGRDVKCVKVPQDPGLVQRPGDLGGVLPGRPGPDVALQALAALSNQGVSETDAFITLLTPMLGRPEVPALHAEARTLRAELLRLRQAAGANASKDELRRVVTDVRNAHGRVVKQWLPVTQRYSGLDPRQLVPLEDLIRQMDRTLQ